MVSMLVVLAEGHARHFLHDGVDAGAVGVIQRLAIQHRNSDWHRLQRGVTARGVDGHARHRCAFIAVLQRRWICLLGARISRGDQQSADGQRAKNLLIALHVLIP
jgi:hypothetical protein